MNRRAARRHPPAQKAKAGRTPARALPGAGSASTRRATPSGGLRSLLYPEWARNIVSELRKVVWPSGEETRSLTIVVIVVAVAIGIMLGIVDFIFSWLSEQLLV